MMYCVGKVTLFSIGTELSHLAIERNIDSLIKILCKYILGNSTISCFLYRSQGINRRDESSRCV